MQIPSINPIRTNLIDTAAQPAKQTGAAENVTKSFGQVLNSLAQSETNSDNLVSQLASGGNVDLHNLVIAAEENDVNYRVTIAIRDRLVDAYREVMRMSI